MGEMIRREALPADKQRPEGVDPSQDGEFVPSNDEVTKAEDVMACKDCDKEFKTERGLSSHMDSKHVFRIEQ